MTGLHDRIRQRLAETKKTMAEASRAAGLSDQSISKMLREPDHSQTLETVSKLAKGLETTPEWLAYGIAADGSRDDNAHRITVSRDLLTQILHFVLTHEGVADRRAALIADILPEALLGPPIEAVERDLFQSFRVHYQLVSRKSEHSAPQ